MKTEANEKSDKMKIEKRSDLRPSFYLWPCHIACPRALLARERRSRRVRYSLGSDRSKQVPGPWEKTGEQAR